MQFFEFSLNSRPFFLRFLSQRKITTLMHDDVLRFDPSEEIGEALGRGPLDLLVNNAATTGGAGGGVENVAIDRFKSLFEVNFWGQVRVTQAALPFIRRSEDGRIINVKSSFVPGLADCARERALTRSMLSADV